MKRFLRVVPLLAAGLLVAAALPRDDGENLLIQTAMRQGRESIERQEYGQAVRVLEAHLSRINGNAAYLELLEEAYRGHIHSLNERGETELALKFHQKLSILDKGAKFETAVRPADPPFSRDQTQGKLGDKPVGATVSRTPAKLLESADSAFRERRYRHADALYQQAYERDSQLGAIHKERWAYCKLLLAAEAVESDRGDWPTLERETRFALDLAPRLDFGRTILDQILIRGKGAEEGVPPAQPEVGAEPPHAVRHLRNRLSGWQVCESANFRVFHQDRKLGEQVAQAAERARLAALARWAAKKRPADWRLRCDVFLHATAQDYARATGASADSPGHSTLDFGPSGVETRRIDLHVDDPRMLTAVLPHETTHCTLADQFGPKPIPRWADEGMALLSEPPEHLERLLVPLARLRGEGRVFSAKQLLAQNEYPERRMLEAFYAQSALLVQYLSELRDPQTFGKFLTDAQRDGYESALETHYQIRGLDDLHRQWETRVTEVLSRTARH